MTEYEEWKNTPGRLGILVSKGDFKKGRYSGDETELFRAEFKERPRQIITKVIIGKPENSFDTKADKCNTDIAESPVTNRAWAAETHILRCGYFLVYTKKTIYA